MVFIQNPKTVFISIIIEEPKYAVDRSTSILTNINKKIIKLTLKNFEILLDFTELFIYYINVQFYCKMKGN